VKATLGFLRFLRIFRIIEDFWGVFRIFENISGIFEFFGVAEFGHNCDF
jgi:hypothetical protein